jgi:hypothetical protein
MNKMILFYRATMMTNELFRKELGALLVWIATLLYLRGFPAMKLPPTPSECVELIVELLLECQNCSRSNDISKTTKSVTSAPQSKKIRPEISISKPRKPPNKLHARLIVTLRELVQGAWSFSRERTHYSKERTRKKSRHKFETRIPFSEGASRLSFVFRTRLIVVCLITMLGC